jgi:hypothetical protein
LGWLVSILALLLAGVACLPVGAQAAFGLGEFDVTFTNADGSAAAQAGSHPFAFTTSLAMNLSGEEPDGRLRELFLDLPPGLIASTTAYPRCAQEEFVDPEKSCPLETAVGSAVVSIIEPDNQETALIYNLAPPGGELIRLGFRVADTEDVYVDVGLSPEPPYRLIAAIGDGPETIDVFNLEIQLWGNPSDSAHDAQRGGQVGVPLGPMLTLPTSCEEPQATFYEALSWEDDADFGSVVTHDGAGEPMGFFGCHHLAFLPSSSAQPTTKEAQSRSGLDASFTLVDDGLANPTGIAQSQVRDLILALPGGMTVDPSLASASGSCSEADVEAETPDSAPGDGCPASSEVGTAEAESPLLEEPVEGAIYRATPNENFVESTMALYVVLKNADLGVVIAQPVALETDADTGQLFAVAEEMPQLPFSQLSMHLNDGTLVSPAHCGEYTPKAFFEPWSDEGPFLATSSFSIVSGPNGGPCPTGEPKSQPEEAAGSPPASGAPPPSSAPGSSHPHPSAKPRCPRGKHPVHRHGKTHCARKRHGKNHKHRQHPR